MINLSPVSSTVFSKGSVTGCDSSLGGGGMIFHFRLSKSILLFVNWNSLCFFYLIYSANMLCLLLLYFIRFYHALLSVSSQDFYCSLPKDQSRDVTPRLGVFVILQCTLFAYASSFRLLLLRLCNNRCAEALVVKLKFSIESPVLRLMRLNS